MKKICLLTAAILLLAAPVTRADIHGFDLLSVDDTDAVTDSLLTAPRPQKPHRLRNGRQLEQARERVWEEWCHTLTSSVDTAKLPPELTPLGSDTAVWDIPPELEPDARMLIYHGYKGDSTGSAPQSLLIYLHGSGPRDMEWQNGLRLCRSFDDAPSEYIIPRIANQGEWYRWYQRGKQQAIESWMRLAMARGIDPDRIYIFGISEGGYGSQRLASFYADYLAGAGPMAGGEPLRNAPPENLRNTAFSLLTGELDNGFYRNRLTGVTGAALDSLERGEMAKGTTAGYIHRVEHIPGRGHGIDYSVMTPWLIKHKRNPYPSKVTWENYDMDNRRRNAFHNLAVSEPRLTDADGTPLRTRYDMVIDSAANSIELTVSRVHYTVTETDPNWGIQLTFDRRYEPADSGLVRIYLSPELIDLGRPVTVTVNGKKMKSIKPEMTEETLRESCMLFGDPRRLYPAAITVDLGRQAIR